MKNNFLLAIDSNGKTAWNVAVRCCKLDGMQKLWVWAKENLTTEKIKINLLLDTDRDGQKAWHVATNYGKLDVVQELLQLTKEILTK
jgi:hypothetical protein